MSRRPAVLLFEKQEPTTTGTSRYATRLAVALQDLGYAVAERRSAPPWPGWLGRAVRRTGLDLSAFWSSYPPIPPPRHGAVLHITSQTLATSLAFVRPRGPTVVTVHDILPFTLRDDPALSTLRHPLDALCYRLALRGLANAQALICDSRYTADELARVVPGVVGRITVVPLGVDVQGLGQARVETEMLRRLGVPDGRYLLYVGSEDPRKNLPALIRAFAHLARSRPDLYFVKVGVAHHTRRRAEIKRLADELGVAERLVFLEHVDDAQLGAIYACAAVAVQPSLFEGFGLPVLEAMAAGAPVVAADRSSLPEIAGGAALLAPPDARGLADAIARVIDDHGFADELRERGYQHAARHSWRRVAEETAAVYQRVQRDALH